MQSVRIWFRKNGRAKYISHLDLMRSMAKALKRSGLKVRYTEGFNPHAYMTFPLPLSLGVESERECMDTDIAEDLSLEEIKNRFDGIMPEGLEVFDVTVPYNDAKEIRYAGYKITLEFENEEDSSEYASLVRKAVTEKELTAEKKGKQGRRKVLKTVVLNPHIFDFSVVKDENVVVITVKLSSGNVMNVNPQLLVSALDKQIDVKPVYLRYEKTGLYVDGFEIFR